LAEDAASEKHLKQNYQGIVIQSWSFVKGGKAILIFEKKKEAENLVKKPKAEKNPSEKRSQPGGLLGKKAKNGKGAQDSF